MLQNGYHPITHQIPILSCGLIGLNPGPRARTVKPGPRHLRVVYNNNHNRKLVTLAEQTSDHGKQTNSSTKAKGEQG